MVLEMERLMGTAQGLPAGEAKESGTISRREALNGSLMRDDVQDAGAQSVVSVSMTIGAGYKDAQRLQGCLAALASGEARRALSILSAAKQSDRVEAALKSWARQMDQNWYPGGVGAETPMDPSGLIGDATPGRPIEELLEHVVVYGFPALMAARAVIECAVRDGDGFLVQQVASSAVGGLEKLARYAQGRKLTDLVNWAALATADLLHRAGSPASHVVLRDARAQLRHTSDMGRLALSHLIEGDWFAAPGSSPESLGWDLAPQRGPSPLPGADLERATACYRQASEIAMRERFPRLLGSIALRSAMLARLAGDADSRRRHLRAASEAARAARDSASQHLVAIHQLVAEIDEGVLSQHALDLGSGWHTPTKGPIADVLAWARSAGSVSWCVGLGRLLQRCGDSWTTGGSAPRARIAYLGALALMSAEPAVPSLDLMTAIANSDIRSGLAVNASLRLEHTFGPMLADTHNRDPITFAQKLEASWVLVPALRELSRGPASAFAIERLERLRDEMARASENIRGTLPSVQEPLPQTMEELRGALRPKGPGSVEERMAAMQQQILLMQQMNLDQATIIVRTIDVLIPLARADAADLSGDLGDADRWYDKAIEAARTGGAPKHLLPLALIVARREEEARFELRKQGRDIADDLQFSLWVRVRDYGMASSALKRMGAAGIPSDDWRGLLARAEMSLGQGRIDEARRTLRQAIYAFEDAVRTLLRDPDRLEACDQPDVAALYATLALSHLQPGEQPVATDAATSYEAAERARALTYDTPADNLAAGTRLAWQRAAAQYSAVANRLLATLVHPRLRTDAANDALARADVALAEAERVADSQDPGVLLRRASPRRGISVDDIRRELPHGSLLLEYLAIGEDLLSWALSTDGLRPVRQAVRLRNLSGMVRKFHAACVAGHGHSEELSQLLLEPFADLLVDRPRVLIVPFGPLNLVPFHALRLGGEPLGLNHVVSYLPRAALLLEGDAHRDKPVSRSQPLMVGDPAFDPDSYPWLRRLPGAGIEAVACAATLKTTSENLLVGSRASKAAVLDRLGSADLLHISSHGHLDELSPFSSSLVLAGTDQLTVADIAGLSFHTDLAVLTGCDTGRGNATLGGDVVGLARSLLRNGVDRAVVSLWPIDDAVAPVTMQHFYAGLAQDLSPAHALAQAQRDVHTMGADELTAAYVQLDGRGGTTQGRRGRDARPGPIEPRNEDGRLPGRAERYWAPFVLIG